MSITCEFKPRGGGKTYAAIQHSHYSGSIIVCLSKEEAERIKEEAACLYGEDAIPDPLSYHEIKSRSLIGKSIVVDNADIILSQLLGGARIAMITATGKEE